MNNAILLNNATLNFAQTSVLTNSTEYIPKESSSKYNRRGICQVK